MNDTELLRQVSLPLLDWYRENRRDLPWRRTSDPYPIWVSEIMLQQTRVAAVIGYYERFLGAFPHIADLAAADDDALMKQWQGLGYYSRARNLKRAAIEIVKNHGGRFPDTYEKILSLPGIGEYTAGAIASIAFGLPVPAVDGNVLRVTARLTGDEADITLPATKKRVREALLQAMPQDAPGEFNQAMMELGATMCLPNGKPDCANCPLREFCAAHRDDLTDALPVTPKKKPRSVEERVVYLVFFNEKVAVRRRPERGLLSGLFEFPSRMKVEPAPNIPGRCVPGPAAKHIFTHREWRMESRVIHADSDVLPDGWIWADAVELNSIYAIPSAFSGFMEEVFRNIRGSAGQ